MGFFLELMSSFLESRSRKSFECLTTLTVKWQISPPYFLPLRLHPFPSSLCHHCRLAAKWVWQSRGKRDLLLCIVVQLGFSLQNESVWLGGPNTMLEYIEHDWWMNNTENVSVYFLHWTYKHEEKIRADFFGSFHFSQVWGIFKCTKFEQLFCRCDERKHILKAGLAMKFEMWRRKMKTVHFFNSFSRKSGKVVNADRR